MGEIMARHFHQRSSAGELMRDFLQTFPWRFLLLLPLLALVGIPAFIFGTHAGQRILPAVTNYFYNLSNAQPTVVPTPYPPFPTRLPQVGPILYTVQAGDNCDAILTYEMHMTDASTIFSDANPQTVKALDAVIGQDCHALQPGMVLTLYPQYPLVALGGIVLKVTPTGPQEVLPTPLINVAPTQQAGVDCSSGCNLVVRLSPSTAIYLSVQTTLPVKVGSWIWAQAALARKSVPNFTNYPYADPNASLNGMSLRACDLQVDNVHDDNSLSCDQLSPNTIDDDGGSWLFGVVGPGGLNHWNYNLHLPTGTQVLLWLTLDNNGNLIYHKGNPIYRYDPASHLYVPAG
ncbi:MAG TPA: hypothetical protein VKV40_03170 [Ktedonobacteraceae bacterium]|nr:hypothetical protein [Ktedonobacteraceae bacterium]